MLDRTRQTAIPRYPKARQPAELAKRCACGCRYLIFAGAPIGDDGTAERRARALAAVIEARFVDASTEPWVACSSCGEILDVAAEVTGGVM